MTKNKYDTVDATPVKSFFVDMLTRDIELVDAILDLLDNCVDGILRQKKNSSGETPYEGFEAEINLIKIRFPLPITVVAYPGVIMSTLSVWVRIPKIETAICRPLVFME